MSSSTLQIVIDGKWLSLEARYGDVSMSKCWPGGSDQLTWSLDTPLLGRGNQEVTAYFGPVPVWAGSLIEPDSSQPQITAIGAWHEAANSSGRGYAALGSSGAATNIPNVAIDQAISRGLRWTRPNSIRSTAISIDISSGPVNLADMLDSWGEDNGQRWGVDPRRQVYAKADDTAPSYQTLPLREGLGFALDNYASTLVGRYISSSTHAPATLIYPPSSTADPPYGHAEELVDLTGKGEISSTTATNILKSLITLGRAVPQWTAELQFAYGEILNMGGVPVALETVDAGKMLRVQSNFDLAQRMHGQLYIDVPIGQTTLAGGLLTVRPLGFVGRTTLEDALMAAANKRRA